MRHEEPRERIRMTPAVQEDLWARARVVLNRFPKETLRRRFYRNFILKAAGVLRELIPYEDKLRLLRAGVEQYVARGLDRRALKKLLMDVLSVRLSEEGQDGPKG